MVCRAHKTTHYDVLGIDIDASEEEVRAAFRRKAKELHPDVNQESGADAAFMEVKNAYDTLSDPGRRREYDAANSVRRFGFFRDVDLEAEAAARGFGAAGGSGGGGGAGRGVNPWDMHRRIWEEEEEEAEQRRRQRRAARPFDDSDPPEDAEEGGASGAAPEDPADFLERLSRVMGGGGAGSMSAFQSGRLDPFGTSSSDAWFRRVEQQRAAPFGSRPAGGFGGGLGGERPGGNPEWEPFRPGDGGRDFDGWRRPGQQPEWGRRPEWGPSYEEDDERDGRSGGRGGGGGSRPLKGDDFRRGGGGGGGFRGW